MRLSLPILALSILSACSTAPTEEQGTTVPVEPVAETPIEWPGYYEDTLPCADCKGIHTQLWLRSDSTFVRRARYLGRDSLAFGAIGGWKVANGLLLLVQPGDMPDHFRYDAPGLRMVDAAGKPFDSGHPYTLEKLADELQDEVPRMRLMGTFTYYADAMSFRPCGSRFSWPCAGGEQWTDEGEVLGSLNTAELERHYLRSVKQGGDPWLIEVECNLAMGPAMEGDGADEYLFIHRVLGPIEACP